jgi:hypothetical protein
MARGERVEHAGSDKPLAAPARLRLCGLISFACAPSDSPCFRARQAQKNAQDKNATGLWVDSALEMFRRIFGGATAYPNTNWPPWFVTTADGPNAIINPTHHNIPTIQPEIRPSKAGGPPPEFHG